jgi:hypothetical protein
VVCPGEKVLFFDNKMNPDYWYYITFDDGYSYIYTNTFEDTVLFTLGSRAAYKSFRYEFTVYNTSCGTSVTKSDTVSVTTDNPTPYYYVSNSSKSNNGNNGNMEDYSKRVYPTDMEMNIPFMAPMLTGPDTVYIFFWKDSVDLNQQPSGVIKYFGSDLTNTTITAYVPYNGVKTNFGIGAGYYCDYRTALNQFPDAFFTLSKTAQYITAGNITLSDTLKLDPIVCNSSSILGNWYSSVNDVSVMFDKDKYTIEQKSNGKYFSDGTLSDMGDNYYYLIDTKSCTGWPNGFYQINRNADTLTIRASGDSCSSRTSALSPQKFVFVVPSKNNENNYCPGDPVQFSSVGGQSVTWHFGDGKTSTEQYPLHAYNSTGTYNAYAELKNTCGGTDTIYTPVTISNTGKVRANIKMNGGEWRVGSEMFFSAGDRYSYSPDKYKWFVDEAFFDTTKDISYIFTTAGNHNIKLVAYTGCASDTAYFPLNISSSVCYAAFTVTPIGTSNTYKFEALLKGADKYEWNMNGIDFFNTDTVTYTFTDPYYNTVSLAVTPAGQPSPCYSDVRYFYLRDTS